MILCGDSRPRSRNGRWFLLLLSLAATIQWIGETAQAQSIAPVEARITSVKGIALRYDRQRSYTLTRCKERLARSRISALAGDSPQICWQNISSRSIPIWARHAMFSCYAIRSNVKENCDGLR